MVAGGEGGVWEWIRGGVAYEGSHVSDWNGGVSKIGEHMDFGGRFSPFVPACECLCIGQNLVDYE